MTTDNIPTSPPEGSVAAPPAPSEPAGVAAPAPAVTPPAPAATSSQTPAPGTAASPAQPSKADLAFDQLMADPSAHDNQPPAPPAQPPAPAAPQPPPAPQAPPTPPPSEPPAAESEDPEPSPAEHQEGKAPVKKLVRALKQRAEFRAEAEAAKAQLAQEQALTDGFLRALDAAGVEPTQLQPFIANLARHRNDPQAQAALLQSLGIQAPVAKPTVDLAALKARLEAYDAEGALALINATPPVQPPAPAAAPQAQPPPPAVPQPPSAQQVNVLKDTVQTMGAVLRDTYGVQEASRLAGLIDAEAKARIKDMVDMDAVVTPAAMAKVWRKAQGTVLQAEKQRLAAPPAPVQPPPVVPAQPPAPVIRPGQPPAPRKMTADEAFADLQARGY